MHTGLDVTPYHRSHITLVVHETGIEIWRLIWVCRDDVGLTTGEGIFEEVEHGEEFSSWHQHVITEPSAELSYC